MKEQNTMKTKLTKLQPKHTSNKGSTEPQNTTSKKEETSSKLEVKA